METLWQDLRYGVRMTIKTPAFTAVALLALALGIGANTAIFSVVNAVLLNPLPYKDPDRLVVALHDKDNPVSPADFADWQQQNTVFDDLTAAEYWTPNLTGRDQPEQIWAVRATGGLFKLLGVEPILGRAFIPGEDQPDAAPVVVLGHRLWQRRFGSDPGVIGRTLTLDGRAYTVVGVMPSGFEFPLFWATKAEMWSPLSLADRSTSRARSLRIFARLRPDVTLSQAQADMDLIAGRISQAHPDTNTDLGVSVAPLHQKIVGRVRQSLVVLVAAVGFILLIACANVANLLLARAGSRRKEIAIRLALGATRLRLVRQLLTESLVLAALSGASGLLLAFWAVKVFVAGLPEDMMPRQRTIGVEGGALGFTLVISILTAVVFGLAPALQASRFDLNGSLKEGGRQPDAGGRGHRLRRLLVVSEIALALVLLVGAGLMIRSFSELSAIDPGFDSANVLTMTVSVAGTRHSPGPQRAAFFEEVIENVKALPGVASVSAVNHLPLAGDIWRWPFTVEGHPPPPPGQRPAAAYRVARPDYFRTLGITLFDGRDFTERDTTEAPGVVIINEAMAAAYWPGETAVGRRIKLGSLESKTPWLSVIGVVKDVKQRDWVEDAGGEIYLPYLQSPNYLNSPAPHFSYLTLVVRAASGSASLAEPVRSAIWAIEPNAPVSSVATMDKVISDQVWQPRFSAILLGGFALLALVLAATGIYGVMSYTVAERSHEIGIRMALGARASDVLRLVIGQGMALALAGVVIGLAGAFAMTRVMRSLLFGVSATDRVTFATVAALLAGVALVACYIPARRATKVDPMIALKYE